MDEFGVQATTLPPAKLFEGRLLRVPDYQRGYAWERRQWEEFVEDLELLPPGSVHYTGTIVLHAVPDGEPVRDRRGKQYRELDIVDGQQRLTTIVLFLDAIRREFLTLEMEDLASGLYDTFIAITDRNGQPHPKIRLNEDCHDYFFQHILHDEPSPEGARIRSHRNLSEARDYFREYLAGQREQRGAGYATWLEQLRDKVCDQLELTLYAVRREADAGVIFEVMNNRGRPITELEKAKNYLLYLASKLQLDADHDLVRLINQTWTHIFTCLMSRNLGAVENEDQLLRSHWFMAYNPKERDWEGSKSLKAWFSLREYAGRHEVLLHALLEYVRTLQDAATAYCDIADPQHPEAFNDFRASPDTRREVVRVGQKLPRLRVVAPFIPLLMAIRLKRAGNADRYLEAVSLCERYAFRVYRLLRRRSNSGRSSFFLTANSLYKGESSPDEALGLVRGWVHWYSPDEDVRQAFALRVHNDWYNWVGIKYFLYEYEEHLAQAKHKNLKIAWAHLEKDGQKKHTIEHILPQAATHEYWTSRFDDAARLKCLHDLGNLCLTLDNSSYGRKPFPEKRGEAGSGSRCYAEGDLVMERDLAAHEDWTPEAVESRRERIVAWALARWHVEPPAAGPEPEEEAIVEVDDQEPDIQVDEVEEPATAEE